MDVSLHWSGAWPEHLQPLLDALESLPETARAPDGAVVFCPDGAALPPPVATDAALVAALARPEQLSDTRSSGALTEPLAAWAERGALFIVPTSYAAAALRALLGLAPERVRVVPVPLPPARIPPACSEGGEDVLAIYPTAYSWVLTAVSLLRIVGLEPRLLLAGPGADALVRPAGAVGSYGLLAGREVLAVSDWREAVPSAGAIVLSGSDCGMGSTLREALATGRPVVAGASPFVTEHLATIGAGAYMYEDPRTLVSALVSALRHDRGEGLEPAAREAVLSERWETSARGLFTTLLDAIGHPPSIQLSEPRERAPIPASTPAAKVVSEPLRVCVLNPNSSGGGGERFMRQLVLAMASHKSRPRLKLVCQVKPGVAFDAGTQALIDAGVETRIEPMSDFALAISEETKDCDVVYYTWPHLSAPPDVKVPLTCTFHDFNWKYFDVYTPEQKAACERETPQWIERASAIVHSSQFIRRQMQQFYAPPEPLTHVITLATEISSDPPPIADREHVRRRFALPERFLLSPNGRHLHKNYPLLDRALRLLRADGRPVSVVASGLGTDMYNGPDLLGLGYISASELQALYAECEGVVQTTLYEAGSFPMAEAMAAGKPVSISRIPPILEQVERLGLVADLFDPFDPEDAAESLWRLWSGSRATAPETIAANARAIAARTWDGVAGDYLKLFASLT